MSEDYSKVLDVHTAELHTLIDTIVMQEEIIRGMKKDIENIKKKLEMISKSDTTRLPDEQQEQENQ